MTRAKQNLHIRCWCLCFTGSGTVELQLCLLFLQISPTCKKKYVGDLNFVSPPHRRAYTSLSKPYPDKIFPHQQDFFPIKSVTKSLTARFSHENLVEKFKIFVQDFVPIKAVLMGTKSCTKILIFSTRFSCRRRFRNALYGEKILMGKCFVWAWFRQTCICSSLRGRYKIQSAEG